MAPSNPPLRMTVGVGVAAVLVVAFAWRWSRGGRRSSDLHSAEQTSQEYTEQAAPAVGVDKGCGPAVGVDGGGSGGAAAAGVTDTNSEPPATLIEGSDDDLPLSFNVAGFKAYATKMRRDEVFLVTAELVGRHIPTTAAEAAALLATLEAKGGDFVDEFKAPVVCRVLKDKAIDWAEESAGGRLLFELVGRLLNGYDGLAV